MLNRKHWIGGLMGLVGGLIISASAASAATVPFTESFDSSVSGWEDSTNIALAFNPTGGSDGGGYASGTFNFNGYSNPFGGGPVLFRASAADNASGGALMGDWIADGVGLVTAMVRHDAPEAIGFFIRVATPANFPGAVIANTQLVQANVWTQVTWVVDVSSPFCVGEGGPCAPSFLNVGNFQIGSSVPAGLIDDDVFYNFDVDRVSLTAIPEPSTALLLGLGLAALARMRPSARAELA